MGKLKLYNTIQSIQGTTAKKFKLYNSFTSPTPSVSVGERIGYGAAGTVLGLGQGIASNKAQERYLLPQVQHRIRGLSREKKKIRTFSHVPTFSSLNPCP